MFWISKKEATFVPPKRVFFLEMLKKADGALAQSVEQRTENPCVAGSIPAGTTQKASTLLRLFCF